VIAIVHAVHAGDGVNAHPSGDMIHILNRIIRIRHPVEPEPYRTTTRWNNHED